VLAPVREQAPVQMLEQVLEQVCSPSLGVAQLRARPCCPHRHRLHSRRARRGWPTTPGAGVAGYRM